MQYSRYQEAIGYIKIKQSKLRDKWYYQKGEKRIFPSDKRVSSTGRRENLTRH